MKIFISISVFIILVLLSLFNIIILNVKDYEPEFYYISNSIIKFFYLFSLIINLLLCLIIVINLVKKSFFLQKNNYIGSIILICLNILLIWFEFIYSSFFYYGGIGKHQNPFLGSNNLGFIGSIFFCICLFLVFFFRSNSKTDKKLSELFLFIFSILLVHIILYFLF